jgi:radical SAM protein with 4Fe4S-binding SPASM domain
MTQLAHEVEAVPTGQELPGRRLEHMRIAVSYYCSLKCQHCYVPELNRTKYKSRLESSQLSLVEICAFIDRLVDSLGLQKITVTGGEALLRNVWPRTRVVMRHGLDRGLTVQLNTSGSGQIDISEVVEVCGDDLNKFVLHLSLDGIDNDRVDVFRGKTGAMKRAVKTLDDAAAAGMRIETRYTMTEQNADETLPTYRFVSERGSTAFVMKPMFAAGTARENQDILVRSREEVRSVQWQLLKESRGNPTALGLPEPVYIPESAFPEGANAYVVKCLCGHGAGYLSTNGDIYPCSYIVGAPDDKQWVLGNIRDPEWDFVEAWRRPESYRSFREAKVDQNCTAQNIVTTGLDVDMEVGPEAAEAAESTGGCCNGSDGACACSAAAAGA